MKKTLPIIIGIIILSVILTLGCMAFLQSKKHEEQTSLANCLTEKGFELAGTSWCPHCKDQKEMFGESVQYIKFHDCEEEPEWCQARGIDRYPSWVSPLGSVSPGVKDFNTLRQMSGCR